MRSLKRAEALSSDRSVVKRQLPKSYGEQLVDELVGIRDTFLDIIESSTIINIDPNEPGSGVAFIGFPQWGWGSSDSAATAARMKLLARFRDWTARVRLLLPHATTGVSKRLDDSIDLVQRWLDRPGRDHSVPGSIDAAASKAARVFDTLSDVLTTAIVGDGSTPVLRLVPDTNALLNNPDLGSYGAALGEPTYVVHLLPTVLGELDELKDRGRTPELREKAQRVSRRLKGLRDKGRLSDGVALTRTVTVRAEHADADPPSVLDWLTRDSQDDRILAGAVALQSSHPNARVVLVTGDMGLQTKADAARLPYAETPPDPATLRAKLSAHIGYRATGRAPGQTALSVTLTNVGSRVATQVEYRVESLPDDVPFTTNGPWTVPTLTPGAADHHDIFGFFGETALVHASWVDDAGAQAQTWTVDVPRT